MQKLIIDKLYVQLDNMPAKRWYAHKTMRISLRRVHVLSEWLIWFMRTHSAKAKKERM